MSEDVTVHDVELALSAIPVPTWVLDATGTRIVGIAPSATRVTGRSEADVVGLPATSIVVPEEAGAFATWLRSGLVSGMSEEALGASWRLAGADSGSPAVRFALIAACWRGTPVVGLSAVIIPSPGELQIQYVETWHRYHQLIAALPLAVWTVDRELRFTSVAGSAIDCPAERLLGHSVGDLVESPPMRDDTLRVHARAVDGHPGEFDSEWGGRTWKNEVAPLRDAQGRIVGAIGLCREVTAERHASHALEDSRQRLRLLAQRLRVVREEEQKRISREIHDQIGGTISLLRVELSRLDARIGPRRVEERRIVQRLLDTASDLLSNIRRVAAELRPPVLENVAEFGLGPVLESMAGDYARRADLPIELDVDIGPGALDAPRAEAAYHVVREALTNVVSHARATRARVVARVEAGLLRVAVADDGMGILPAVADSPRALGLLGIRERVLAWGGDVTIRGEAGEGTTLEARIPLHGPAPLDEP
jgi:two-component system sensor histidine kinase UhpB